MTAIRVIDEYNESGIKFNAKKYGAKGDGITNDSAAIQAAIQAAAAANPKGIVWLPDGKFLITNSLIIDSGINYCRGLTCISKSSSCLYSTENIPYIIIDTTDGRVDELEISNLRFVSNNSGTRTNTCGLKYIGGNWFNKNVFKDLLFVGTYYGIYNLRDKGDSSTSYEGKHDWNFYNNIQFTNYGSYNVEYGIKFFWGGGGTGNIFSNISGSAATSVIEMGHASDHSENVGDIIFEGLQFSVATNGIKLIGGTNYGDRITVANAQFDAGITNGLNFNNMRHFNVINTMFGGASAPVFTNCSNYTLFGSATDSNTFRYYGNTGQLIAELTNSGDLSIGDSSTSSTISIDGSKSHLLLKRGGVNKVRLMAFTNGHTYFDYDGSLYFRSGIDGTNKVDLYATGDMVLNSGSLDAYTGFKVNGTAGVSGTFTTNDGKTVTVTKGIITSIS